MQDAGSRLGMPVAIMAGIVVVTLLVGLRVWYSREASETLSEGVAAGSSARASTMPVVRLAKNPEPLPAFSVARLDGRTLSPAEWRGKVAIVNFWATWCPPCREEIPAFIELQEKYAGDLIIVGLSVDETAPEVVAAFVEDHGITYPVAIVDAALQATFGGIPGLPTSFVVDREGRVVQKHVGLVSADVYEREVRVLAGLPVDAQVELFEDTGEVNLANAAHATEIPGVELSALTVAEREAALLRLNSDACSCGCALTLAQCRINDSSCSVSLPLARRVVSEIAGGGT